eukprot:2385924-Pyramimonas_sp.AAC.1
MEYSDAVQQRKGQTTHVGRLFAILVEKNAELPELSRSPATTQASQAAGTYGLFEGNDIQQVDAKQAYAQSKLGGTPTWFSSREKNGRLLGRV